MSAHPAFFQSPRAVRRLFWLSLLVLASGVVAALVVFPGRSGRPLEQTVGNQPADVVKPEKNVPVDPAVRRVAGRFILTAVQRKHLAEAWTLAGPHIRQDLTYAQWLTGNIPVVPVFDPIVGATYKTDYSHPSEVLLEVALIVEKTAKSDHSAKIFYITLKRFGADRRWLVDGWVPYVPVAIPRNLGN